MFNDLCNYRRGIAPFLLYNDLTHLRMIFAGHSEEIHSWLNTAEIKPHIVESTDHLDRFSDQELVMLIGF